jgi:hypothetical protein
VILKLHQGFILVILKKGWMYEILGGSFIVKRPLGVSLISYFYIFGAFILLMTTVFYDAEANQIDLAASLV